MCLALLMPSALNAKPRTLQQKMQAATAAFSKGQLSKMMKAKKAPMKQLKAADDYTVFGYDNGGFAIIANDDLVPAVLGYSESSFDDKAGNESFKWWLSAVSEVVKKNVEEGKTIARTTKPTDGNFPEAVHMLLTTKWGQEAPFNNLCPIATDGSGKCLTGCAATATAQVFYYHKGPKNGMGSHTIYYPYGMTSGVAISVDFEKSIYDWTNMIDVYDKGYSTQEADAVAMLMRDLGVAADMEYGSAAQGGSGALHETLARGLQRYYGLTDVKYLEREDYTEQEWMNVVYDQLSRNLPIVYGGFTKQREGHSFVLDGYDAEGLVHVNWGWNGDQNGYYDIAILDPVGYKFTQMQEAVINIEPTPAISRISGEVSVTKPGTLRSLLKEESFFHYEGLKVNGDINATDIRTIREMAGVDENGGRTRGRLQKLDLSNTNILAGSDYYLIDKGNKLTIKTDNTLPDKLFYGCSMEEISFPSAGIHNFGKGVWAYCNKLSHVSLTPAADANFKVDGNMVYNTDRTTLLAVTPLVREDISIPDGVKTIDDYALAGCSMVRKIAIGNDVKNIGREAFGYCWSMEELKVRPKDIPQLGTDVFAAANTQTCKLTVRAGSKARYASLAQWKDFTNIVEFGVTVKARNLSRIYGDDNPELTYTVIGAELEGKPELTCEADKTSDAGRYKIKIGRGTIQDEDVEFEDGYLIVKRAPLEVIVEDATRGKGESNPEFTLRYEGFRNGDTESVFNEKPQTMCVADENSPEGEYEIVVEGGDADNYDFSYTNGKLTVTGATGITAVEADAMLNGKPCDIYSPTGQLVRKQAHSLNGLPSGVYVVKGKKILVK